MSRRTLRAFGLRLDNIGDQRAWLRRDDGTGRKVLALEWSLGRMPSSVGVSLDVSSEPDATASVRLPGASLYVTIPVARAVHDRLVAMARDVGARSYEGIEIASVDVHDRAIWWSFMHPDGSWTRSTPRWRHGNWHVLDSLLGRHAYTSETIEERDVTVPMPEGSYEWKLRFARDVWKRPRWPWGKAIKRAHFDAKPGEQIPTHDKGPLYGLTIPARSVEDAIGRLVTSALEDRARRGYCPEGGKYDTRSEAA